MKVFILAPKENWICDRFVSEWKSNHPNTITEDPESADIIWLLADWCWNQLDPRLLHRKKVLASVHHIVPDKFKEESIREFKMRDYLIDYYHVPCIKTHDQIRSFTQKEIFTMPFWVNGEMWANTQNKPNLREKFNIDSDVFLIGSFQRDTEGHDLKSPKLEKGPDLFCDAVIRLRNDRADKGKSPVEVLLAGWRRQYVMTRLDSAKIKYHYHELPSFEVINKFYNMIDLYIVAARYEGGPQAIFECANIQAPIISTDVGAASMILDKDSIFEPGNEVYAKPNVSFAKEKVKKYLIPDGFSSFENVLSYINGKQK